MADVSPVRKPYTGSCHCGLIKYILFLSLPAPPEVTSAQPEPHQEFYRCACTTCQKAGVFHIRTADAPNDFLLLSPLDPLNELGDYRCFNKVLKWLFCKNCGVRCFTFAGGAMVEEKDLAALGVPGYENGAKTKVWHLTSPDGIVRIDGKEKRSYLSVNGYTLDAKQDGIDLREWTEKKWVLYLDMLEEKGRDQYDRPAVGGAY